MFGGINLVQLYLFSVWSLTVASVSEAALWHTGLTFCVFMRACWGNDVEKRLCVAEKVCFPFTFTLTPASSSLSLHHSPSISFFLYIVYHLLLDIGKMSVVNRKSAIYPALFHFLSPYCFNSTPAGFLIATCCVCCTVPQGPKCVFPAVRLFSPLNLYHLSTIAWQNEKQWEMFP